MATIAQGRFGRFFAAAEVDFFAFGRGKFLGQNAGTLMRAIAKGLLTAFTAGTPEIGLTGFDFDRVGGVLCNNGLIHELFLLVNR